MMKKSDGERLKPISLYPLTPDVALEAILATPPPKKTPRPAKRKKKAARGKR